MKTPPPKIVKKARQMELAHVNAARASEGYLPLTKLERLWWQIYGPKWIAKALENECTSA